MNYISRKLIMGPKPGERNRKLEKELLTFHPKTNAMITQPKRLNTAFIARAIFIPSSCCNCVGSLDTRAVNDPELFSSASKNLIGLARMLSKYSCR